MNPFAELRVPDLVKDFRSRKTGTVHPVSISLEFLFDDMVQALARDGNLKPFKNAMRTHKPLSIMRLIKDARFFRSTDAEKIRSAYNRGNENLQALLDKDICRLVEGDRPILQFYFPDSNIPARMFAAAVLIERTGLTKPTTQQLLRRLDAASAKVAGRAVKLLAHRPNLQEGLNEYLTSAAKKIGFNFDD